ncbi:Zinc finger MYM-type protein 1 [Linum perenne]
MASFAAARSNSQSPRQEEVFNKTTKKGRQSSSSSAAMTLEHANEDDVGSKKIVELEKSTGTGSQEDVSSHEIVGALNSTGTKTREATAADAVETEKSLKRKKVYEDKGKVKAAEPEKEPKKLLLGNKGIVISRQRFSAPQLHCPAASGPPLQFSSSAPRLLVKNQPIAWAWLQSPILRVKQPTVDSPRKRIKICEWPIELRDEVRRKYLLLQAYQPKLSRHVYQTREYGNSSRCFQENWYKEFHWLEYSPTSHKAYCFPCFLFDEDSSSNLVNGGFDNWRRVRKGKDCAFLNHIGTSSSSPHNKAVASAAGLRMPSAHIDRVLERVSRAEVEKHRLRLKTTIKVLQRLALQGCAFRGHDESESSLNRGNLIEWIEFLMEWREDVKAVVLKNAPGNAKYISPLIQKELLSIMANQVRCKIREEVGDAYFSILVDEARDESGREQMAIILRYVTSNGILTERFFAIKSVVNTYAATLKQVISDALSEYNLQVEKLRGQGYDGASNMSGQFNGLRALFLQDCPYAYFVHCFAHRLQLTLVAAAKHCRPIWNFYSLLDNVINLVKSSPKRTTELIEAHQRDLDFMLANGELESGRGANQMTSLQRADHQLSELNSRFNEDTIRLLQLSAALDPKDSFKAFNADHICELAEEFYPKDFDGHDILILKSELPFYTEHVVRNSEFEVSSLAKLMEKLVTRSILATLQVRQHLYTEATEKFAEVAGL